MTSRAEADPLCIVRTGYNKIAAQYTEDRERFEYWTEVAAFTTKLPDHARVLDIGCGTGTPIAKHLIELGCIVTGIDASNEMIAAARKNVPGAAFIEMNMLGLDFPAESYDGLISCYALFHVPRERHGGLLAAFHRVLRPGGHMLLSVGATDWEGVEMYYGVEMFWSHFAPAETEKLITGVGFEIEFGRTIETGGETHHWVLAQKP